MTRIPHHQPDRRRESRFVANAPATLLWDGISEPVTILNISAYGALLETAFLPPIAARITLISDHMEVCGTVIWHGVDRCGLLLSQAIDPLSVIDEPSVGTTEPPITLRKVAPGRYA
ncbi:PilZ domain-containing protein [Sphingobium sp. MK2]|uniref:PilZ domain-containing protein n=1 Tax=Sphingobium sp. MK2 TaxID=3116540 RepID=UPI0032E36673